MTIDMLFPDLPMSVLIAALAVSLVASFVKGAVGFAMPMIMISGLASFMPAKEALAALIIPTVLTNLWQASRGGWRAAALVLHEYRRFLVILLILIAVIAQFVGATPQSLMFLILGVPIVGFALIQLAGVKPHIPPERRWIADLGIGTIAGITGGFSGVWGPPTVLYLTAIDAPKSEAIRVQGVVYGAGAVVLLLAHVHSGVLNAQTLPLSLWVLPAVAVGMVMGQAVQDRLDQRRFRRAMLVVLVIVGLNLVRRGLAGML